MFRKLPTQYAMELVNNVEDLLNAELMTAHLELLAQQTETPTLST